MKARFGGNKCDLCDQPVYQNDLAIVGTLYLHRKCLRCAKCNKRVTEEHSLVVDDKLFCIPHGRTLMPNATLPISTGNTPPDSPTLSCSPTTPNSLQDSGNLLSLSGSERLAAEKNMKPQTVALNKGYDPQRSEGSAVTPVFRTSTFIFKNCAAGKRAFELAYGLAAPVSGESPALIYSRVNNPNSEILEDRLTAWDKKEKALLFSSGMGAISSTCLTFLRPGDSLLFSDPVYGGTEFFFRHMLPEFGVRTAPVPAGATAEEMIKVVEDAGIGGSLKIVYVESPANPTIILSDIAAARKVADHFSTLKKKVLLAVDNTFLGPIFSAPSKFGADIILYSATKFFGGHSDVVAGACLSSAEIITQIKGTRSILGSCGDPDTAWLIQRSLPTLQLRMEKQQENARKIVEFLLSSPKIKSVSYPGLPCMGQRQLELFNSQCTGSGSLITFKVHGGEAEAFCFLDNLQHIKLAVSLGGVESLIEHPATMTHSDMTPAEQEHAGITADMIRLSVGLEDPADLIEDLGNALATLPSE